MIIEGTASVNMSNVEIDAGSYGLRSIGAENVVVIEDSTITSDTSAVNMYAGSATISGDTLLSAPTIL